jgi:hypothetical protein
MAKVMERPTLGKYESRSARDMTRFRRMCAAWDLASLLGEVTDESYDKAYDLLNRCIRYSLASSRMDDTETESNWNSPYRKHKEELLGKRRERLNAELKEYGCKFDRAWCCDDVYEYDFERHVPKGEGYLHFFD